MSFLGFGRAAEQVGGAVAQVAEVFTANATKAEQNAADRFTATMTQAGAEFQQPLSGWFDRFVNALNRLPRPLLALATMGLFAYAMADPAGFSVRMQGLAYIPEPLWWLLGAVVSFYFGARELHYFRGDAPRLVPPPPPPSPRAAPPSANAALADWRIMN